MTDIQSYLKHYDGPPLRLMEVCGTHTAQISRCGIVSLLPPSIHMISGPGCPVCVTVTAYIDRLTALCIEPENVVVSFGDMLRVKGSRKSLNDAKAEGGHVRMVYSPQDTLKMAADDPKHTYIFAAVGFETTAPVYTMLLEEAEQAGITNVKLLTSLKTMPPVIDWICANQGGVDGFIAPGHVSVITGSRIFAPLSEKYKIPFAVAGFQGPEILAAIYALVKRRGKAGVLNLYPSAVTEEGNLSAQRMVEKYFVPCDAAWRGMGVIPDSGIRLRDEYARYDAGSEGLTEDCGANARCQCAKVLTGALSPVECPLFGTCCSPEAPQGACMVSMEGSCYNYYINARKTK
ncbi:hydrogenase formation protein HypD [Caproiciproducens galactitolivorans]|uniref:hydrogenase formation protein HypD n=1 Tax=Caproiciproducens galactitolivorans TaxID=642589 RepID=UPI002409E066|nr:hydrogenase formation protein HypD [Caproiciproducens galactitolivorans]